MRGGIFDVYINTYTQLVFSDIILYQRTNFKEFYQKNRGPMEVGITVYSKEETPEGVIKECHEADTARLLSVRDSLIN